MGKKMKLVLDDLNVKSFVTALNGNYKRSVRGGETGDCTLGPECEPGATETCGCGTNTCDCITNETCTCEPCGGGGTGVTAAGTTSRLVHCC